MGVSSGTTIGMTSNQFHGLWSVLLIRSAGTASGDSGSAISRTSSFVTGRGCGPTRTLTLRAERRRTRYRERGRHARHRRRRKSPISPTGDPCPALAVVRHPKDQLLPGRTNGSPRLDGVIGGEVRGIGSALGNEQGRLLVGTRLPGAVVVVPLNGSEVEV